MGKVQFYRPVEFAGQAGTPKDQRASENGPPHRRFFNISPSCDAYFQLHPNKNVVLMLKDVNDCLVSLSSALEEQESLLLNAQREAMRRCGENEQKQSNVRWLAISLLLFPSLSVLSDDDTNHSVTTHDIPQPSVEYDMDDLSNSVILMMTVPQILRIRTSADISILRTQCATVATAWAERMRSVNKTFPMLKGIRASVFSISPCSMISFTGQPFIHQSVVPP